MTVLLPRPHGLESADGSYLFDDNTTIVAPPELASTATWLQGRLRPATGLRLPLASAGDTAGIVIGLDAALGNEAYRLVVEPEGIQIIGGDVAGVFYGAQTLRQLLPPQIFRAAPVAGVTWSVPTVRVEDAPRFRWRGLMLDVARHFLPKREVLRYIELLALHKINMLHLHLTDDQGWRVEIKAFPRLTEIGSWRTGSQVGAPEGSPADGRPHGGFYTQDDIREIVAFAAQHHVQVMPEIELPGHVQAAIAAYPALGVSGESLPVGTAWGIIPHVLNTEQETVDFFKQVLNEVVELFPSPFICVGGDECPTDQWERDPRSQDLMRERGMATERELQLWFMAQIGEQLASLGRRMVGWDEILEGETPASAVIESWRGTAGIYEAARRGHDVVSCPDDQVYLDYRQSEGPDEPIPVGSPLTLRRAYQFDPVPDDATPQEAVHVLGGQANAWTERMDSARVLDFYVFPRLCAIAETLWCDGAKDFDDFALRLDRHLLRLDALGVEYRPASGPHPWQMRPGIPGRPLDLAERQAETNALVAGIRPE